MIKYIARSFLYLFIFILSFILILLVTIFLWPAFLDDESILSLTLYILQIILSITSSIILTKQISVRYLKITGEISGVEENEIPAGIRDRALAMISDSVIIFVIFFIIARIVVFFNVKSLLFDKMALIGMIFFYEPLMVSFFSGTFGHKLFNLKVLTFENKKVPLPFAFIRFFIKLFLGVLSFVTISGKSRRAFQDFATGTKVIYY